MKATSTLAALLLALSISVAQSQTEAAAAVAPEVSTSTYTVQPGDALIKIARKTGCSAADIAAANGMTVDSVIKIGQVLKLPASASTPASTDNPSPVEQEAPKLETYTIQDGDTYFSLSRRLKIPLDDLMAANPKIKANQLYVGRVINLPTKGAVPAPEETPVASPTPKEAVASTEKDTPPTSKDTPPTTQDTPPTTQDTPPTSEKKVIAVSVDQEISYGDFAAKHGTDVERLNSLNDLNLTSATILAKGSELYVPAQP